MARFVEADDNGEYFERFFQEADDEEEEGQAPSLPLPRLLNHGKATSHDKVVVSLLIPFLSSLNLTLSLSF
jgi:hypothetical protein